MRGGLQGRRGCRILPPDSQVGSVIATAQPPPRARESGTSPVVATVVQEILRPFPPNPPRNRGFFSPRDTLPTSDLPSIGHGFTTVCLAHCGLAHCGAFAFNWTRLYDCMPGALWRIVREQPTTNRTLHDARFFGLRWRTRSEKQVDLLPRPAGSHAIDEVRRFQSDGDFSGTGKNFAKREIGKVHPGRSPEPHRSWTAKATRAGQVRI